MLCYKLLLILLILRCLFNRRLRKRLVYPLLFHLVRPSVDIVECLSLDAALGRLRANDPTLKRLRFEEPIGSEGAKTVVEVLVDNTCLLELDLIGCCIGDEGVSYIAKALRTNRIALSRLNLCDNDISDDGAKTIAEALKVNTCLIELYLLQNSIGVEGAKAMAEALKRNSCLRFLDFGKNNIRSDGARTFAEALKVNTCLRCLDLSYNKIGDSGAKTIWKAIATTTELTEFIFDGNGRRRLRVVKAIAKAIAKNAVLTKLSICENNIGSTGMKLIAKALRKNRTLLRCYLCRNGSDHGGLMAMAKALKTNATLTKVDLGYYHYFDGDINNGKIKKAFLAALKTNIVLTELTLGERYDRMPRMMTRFLAENRDKGQIENIRHEALMAPILARNDRLDLLHYRLRSRVDLLIPGLLNRKHKRSAKV